jgi:hypothetical protein
VSLGFAAVWTNSCRPSPWADLSPWRQICWTLSTSCKSGSFLAPKQKICERLLISTRSACTPRRCYGFCCPSSPQTSRVRVAAAKHQVRQEHAVPLRCCHPTARAVENAQLFQCLRLKSILSVQMLVQSGAWPLCCGSDQLVDKF